MKENSGTDTKSDKESLLQQSAEAGVNSEKRHEGGSVEKQLHVRSRAVNNLHQSRVQCCARTLDHMSTRKEGGKQSF